MLQCEFFDHLVSFTRLWLTPFDVEELFGHDLSHVFSSNRRCTLTVCCLSTLGFQILERIFHLLLGPKFVADRIGDVRGTSFIRAWAYSACDLTILFGQGEKIFVHRP